MLRTGTLPGTAQRRAREKAKRAKAAKDTVTTTKAAADMAVAVDTAAGRGRREEVHGEQHREEKAAESAH